MSADPQAAAPPKALAYLTPDQVAAMLQLSAKSIYRLAKADPTMPLLKLAGTVRFPRERLERWLRDREQGPRMRSRRREAEGREIRDREILALLEHAERLEARAAELRAQASQHLRA